MNDTTLPSDNIYRQTPKISALSTGNISKYDFLKSEDVSPENELLEKSTAIKIFEYLLLGSELISKLELQTTNINFYSSKKKMLLITIEKQ